MAATTFEGNAYGVATLGEHGTQDLDAVVSTLLAKNPDERFGSALAVRRALEAALG